MVYRQQSPSSLPLPDPIPSPILEVPPLRRSTRSSHPPEKYGFSYTSLNATSAQITVPNYYSPTVKQECWVKAINEELQALQENRTWDIISCPSGVKPIRCKWV